jgi:transcriptional regulator with XRE-family HTH domain
MESSGIGKVIEILRRKSGLTQAELAELAGISASRLSNIETGKRRVPDHVLVRLCIPLGVKPAAIVALAERSRYEALAEIEAKVCAELGVQEPPVDAASAGMSLSDLEALIDELMAAETARLTAKRAWLQGLAVAVSQPRDSEALIASLPPGVYEELMANETQKRRVGKPRAKKAQHSATGSNAQDRSANGSS